MKLIKSSFFKIVILLITIGSMTIFYWYGYHKTFDEKCIPQNADGIVMADVKNIRNYFIFSYLKNPSQWQWNLGDNRINKRLDLSNYGIETQDYLAFFHIKNQPVTQWFLSSKIENETVFEKAIAKAHFHKTTLQNRMTSYYSESMALFIVRHSSQILLSNIPENQKNIALKTAEDLFLKKLFLDTKKIQKTIDTPNAITIWIEKNSLLEEDGIVNVNLKNQEIQAEGLLKLKSKYRKEVQFSQNPNALLSFGFNFEMLHNQKFITDNSAKINKIIGFDLDSILSHNPTKTELLLNEIVEKKDSAISYDYDDDFNPIKKVIIHTSREPSFSFSMQTDDSKKVYNYLKTQNAIDNHQVFVNFPLAKTKTSIRNNALTLEANPLKKPSLQNSTPKIGYLQLQINKLQSKDWRFIIAKNKNFEFLKSFETLTIELTPKSNSAFFQAHLKTKNEKNLISVIK
jgi:hypothetical protein